MKIIFAFIFMLLTFSGIMTAQESQVKIREVGVRFNNLDNFGIIYKKGSEKSLFRLTLLSLNSMSNNSKKESEKYSRNRSIGLGMNLGFENRKPVTEKLDFYSGLDFISSFSYNSMELIQTLTENTTWNISSGVGFIIGLRYNINNDLAISAEVVPSVLFSVGEIISSVNYVASDEIHSGFEIGFGNRGAGLTLSYRFIK